MGYEWGKNPMGTAGWKSRALAAEGEAAGYRAEIMRLESELGNALTQRNAAREDARYGWQAARTVARVRGQISRLRDRNARNAERVRMLAGDLRAARESLDEVGQVRQQWRTVAELRRRLDGRAARVAALAFRAREFRAEARMLRETLARERETNRVNVGQLEHALANAQTVSTEALRNAENARRDANRWRDDAETVVAQIMDERTRAEAHADRLADRLRIRARRVSALASELRRARVEVERQARFRAYEHGHLRPDFLRLRASSPPAAGEAPATEPVWEARVRDLEGALRDQQSITQTWKREAVAAARAVTVLRGALTTARFNATHTRAEAARALEETEQPNARIMHEGGMNDER